MTNEHRRGVAQLLKDLSKQGWKVFSTSNGHYKCVPPDPKAPIILVGAGGDPRGIKNATSQLRRAGANV